MKEINAAVPIFTGFPYILTMSDLSNDEREKLLVKHLAQLSVVLNLEHPRPGSIRLMLKLAKEDESDWRDLYQKRPA